MAGGPLGEGRARAPLNPLARGLFGQPSGRALILPAPSHAMAAVSDPFPLWRELWLGDFVDGDLGNPGVND